MPDSVPYSLADVFRLNNRVNLMLLDALTEAQLAHIPTPRARSVADQFAHLHNVRIMWLEVQAPAIARSLRKIEKGHVSKPALREALESSAEAFAQMLETAERAGKIRSHKRGVHAFFAYVIAHEAHHRGQVLAHLKHAGTPVDRKLGFALWEWDKL
jgi:uncharacterized damage-inducible protein DinB